MLIKTISTSLLLSTIVFFNACSSDLLNQTPNCSDTGVIDTLKTVLNDDTRKTTVNLDLIMQTKLDKETGMRTCTTTVDYTYTNDGLIGSIKKAIGDDGVSKGNKIKYTLVMNDKGEKYLLQVLNW